MKKRRKDAQVRQDMGDFSAIAGDQSQGKAFVSAQLALAAYQYLATG